ncbi:MAG TPA: CU044_5270 family protein [Streptosporangiaceae bacterium]|nr:CU044_5270 family protein [Streptosporangiaceae bacterium]
MNIESLIGEANPVPAADLPSADSPQARATLTRVLSATGPGGLPSPRLSSRLVARVAVGAAAAAVAAIVVAQLLPGSSPRPATSPGHSDPRTLAGALNALSLLAAAQPAAHPPGPGQYQYSDEKSLTEIDTYKSATNYYAVSYSEQRQIWIASNGSGRIVESFRDPRLASARDRRNWIKDGRPSLRIKPSDQRYGKRQLSVGPANLYKLPTNPARLAKLIHSGAVDGGPVGSAEDFVRIGDVLRETAAPPALRAAIFKVSEQIPGAKLLGRTTDPLGSAGIGIAHWQHVAHRGQVPAETIESVLIFNPKTSNLLAEETLVTYTKTGKTSLTSWTVYLRSGVVNSIASMTPVSGTPGRSSGATT